MSAATLLYQFARIPHLIPAVTVAALRYVWLLIHLCLLLYPSSFEYKCSSLCSDFCSYNTANLSHISFAVLNTMISCIGSSPSPVINQQHYSETVCFLVQFRTCFIIFLLLIGCVSRHSLIRPVRIPSKSWYCKFDSICSFHTIQLELSTFISEAYNV